jgi:hypothetical protein
MSHVHVALRKRYPAPAWAYFEEVRNGTGFARSTARTADALAFSLYPSNGLELHGFEVKVSRGDWLRELGDPTKAAAIGDFCERWSLATAPGVINDVSEIPPSWGWLELKGKGLVQRKAPPLREAKPLDKLMVASILRNASQAANGRIAEAVNAQVAERMEDERKVAKESETKLVDRLRRAETRVAQLSNRLRVVGEHLGLMLADAYFESHGEKLPELPEETLERLSLLGQRDIAEAKRTMQQAAAQLRFAATQARRVLTVAAGHQPRFRGFRHG